MAETNKTHVTCGHCKGTGVCKNIADEDIDEIKSCATCLREEGIRPGEYEIVKCSICNGTGWVKLQ